MFRLLNHTSMQAQRYANWGASGEYQFTVVVKASFVFSPSGEVFAQEPANPIQQTDLYVDPNHPETLIAACEIVPFKSGGEVLLRGHAHHEQVRVAIGKWSKSILVIPAYRRLAWWVFPPPMARSIAVHHFAPIANHLPPRHALFREAVSRSTLSPHGKNPPPNLYNCAPRDQQFPEPFCGDESITLSGFFPETESITWRLPCLNLHLNQDSHVYPLVCDTLQIDTDAKVFDLIFRAGIPAQLFHQQELSDVAIYEK